MTSIGAFVFVVAFVVAEPPPSNSYLPPPSGRAGYPQPSQSIPQIVAARSQDFRDHGALVHGAAANGLTRNNLQVGGHNAFGAQGQSRAHGQSHAQGKSHEGYDQKSQGYEQSAAFQARNALDEANTDPANYNFGYMVSDHHEGTDFGHHEERQEERAQGEYHVLLPDGRKQTVSYEADERGFKPQISYEDTEDLTRSGYDSNANNFRNSGYQGNAGYQDAGYQNNGGYHGNEQNGAAGRSGY